MEIKQRKEIIEKEWKEAQKISSPLEKKVEQVSKKLLALKDSRRKLVRITFSSTIKYFVSISEEDSCYLNIFWHWFSIYHQNEDGQGLSAKASRKNDQMEKQLEKVNY